MPPRTRCRWPPPWGSSWLACCSSCVGWLRMRTGKFRTRRKTVHPTLTRIRRTYRNQHGPTTARPAAASPVTRR